MYQCWCLSQPQHGHHRDEESPRSWTLRRAPKHHPQTTAHISTLGTENRAAQSRRRIAYPIQSNPRIGHIYLSHLLLSWIFLHISLVSSLVKSSLYSHGQILHSHIRIAHRVYSQVLVQACATRFRTFTSTHPADRVAPHLAVAM